MRKGLDELRYALRRLRRNPGFTLAVLLTLALGIGANSLMFSVVNAVFLRPLSYRDPGRLFWATEFFPVFSRTMVLAPEYVAWKNRSTTFEHLEAMSSGTGANLSSAGRSAERVQVGSVTPGFFTMIGIAPRLGSGFDAKSDSTVAIVSDAFWRSYFQADRSIIGKEVIINGKPATIVGVMPPGFIYPDAVDAALWQPYIVRSAAPSRGMQVVRVIGRAKKGITVQQAQADLERIARNMDTQYPTPWSGYHAAAKVRVVALHEELTAESQTSLMPSQGSARAAVLVLMGAVAFLLLIACANVANLFLSRTVARRKEIAMRYAIGAGRWDVMRMLLIESMLTGVLGGLSGMALLFWGRSALKFLMPRALGQAPTIDWRVLAFTAACSLVAGLLFGLIPALAGSRADLNSRLKESAARPGRLPAVLASGQIALSLVLLAGAGLLIRSFLILASTNPGFDARNVLMATANLRPLEVYGPARQVDYYDRLLAGIQKLPGAMDAAISSSPPMAQFSAIETGMRPDNGPERKETVSINSVSANYFRVLGIPLASGRFFDDRDGRGRPKVAIVNQTLARTFFSGHAVGHRIGSDTTIVGVIADIRHRSLDDKVWPEVFLPFEQSASPWMTVFVRGSRDPSALAGAIRSVAQSIDASQPLFDIDLLDHRVAGSLAERRARAAVLATFALLALLIAVVGIYGVMSYSVAQRTNEIGIRMALGADRRDVLRMVVGSGLRITAFGVFVGLGTALLVTRVLRSFLYGITPSDQMTFCIVCAILAAAALGASYLPARSAADVDPMTALRLET